MKISKPITLIAGAMFTLLASGAAAIAAPAVATSSVNVRSGPSTSFAVVDVLLSGQRVNVNRCERNWCYVEKTGPDGWVSSRYLSAPSGSSSAEAEALISIFGSIVGGILSTATPPAPPPPPPPPPPTPTVISAAQIDLPLNWSANLDTGRTGGGSFAGADISQQGLGVSRVIYRQNGALLSLGNRSQRGYSGCSSASYSSSPILVSTISDRTVCVKTNRGRISEFWIVGQRGTTLGIKYKTWR